MIAAIILACIGVIYIMASKPPKHKCSHEFDYMNDMTSRDSTGRVSCKCHKCGEVFKAECGLDLPGTLVQLKKKDRP